jgi:hypothetical protein
VADATTDPADLVELGALKRGDDKTFRAIAVTVDGVTADLTGEDWDVRAQLRPFVSSATEITPAIAAEPLAQGRIVLVLDRALSETMAPGVWVGDVEVTGPGGRQSSETFAVTIHADVTR